MSDHVIAEAIKLRDQLLDAAKEFEIDAQMVEHEKPTKAKLRRIDAERIRAAAAMMEKLGTEVTRLREGIGCYFYTGDPTKAELWRMARTWNGDAAREPKPSGGALAGGGG